MTLTNRTAPDDTAIRYEKMDENIEVSKPGRYYPDDYSTMIRINQQSQGLNGEIPKSLANIVEYYDDYKISTWAHEETERMQEKQIDYKHDEQIREETLKFDMLNADYDRRQHLLSDLDEAAEQAKATDGKVVDAVAGVLDQYAEPEGLSPAARRQWQSSFKQIGESAYKSARNTDYQNAYLQNKANINHMLEVTLAKVANGEMGAGQAFEAGLPELNTFREHMSPAEFEGYVNNMYDACVSMEASLYQARFREGNLKAEAATTNLRGLLSKYRNMTFIGTDTQGKEYKFSCSLSEQTQKQLLSVFNEVKNGGEGGSAVDVDMDVKGWEDAVGWKEFQEKGYTQQITGWTASQFNDNVKDILTTIQSSNLSDSKKYEKAKNIAEKAAILHGQLLIGELLPVYGKDTGRALQIALAKLNGDLNGSSTDFNNYELAIELGGKSMSIVVPPVMKDVSFFGQDSMANKAYWTKYKEGLDKLASFANGKPISVVVAQLDGRLSSKGLEAVGNFTRSNLIVGEGDNAVIAGNSKAVGKMKEYFDAWSIYPDLTPVLSDQMIEGLVKNINDTNLSPRDRLLMQKAIGASLADSKIGKNTFPDIANYIARTENKDAASIFTGLVLSQDNPDSRALFNYLADPKKEDTRKQNLETAKKNSELNKTIDNDVLYSEMNIDKKAGLYFQDLSTKVQMYIANESNPNKAYKQTMKKLLDPMFVSKDMIRGTGLQSRPFRYSPQMKVYNDLKDDSYLQLTMYHATSGVKQRLQSIGMNPQVTIYSDDQAGQFYFVLDGHRIKNLLPNQKGYLGSILNTPEAVKNPSFVGQYNTLNFISSRAAQDKEFRKKIMGLSMQLTPSDRKNLSKQPLSSQAMRMIKGTSDTRTLEELYGGGNQANKKIKAGFIAISATMSNEELMNKALERLNKPSIGKPGGAVQNMAPNSSPLLRVLTYTEPVAQFQYQDAYNQNVSRSRANIGTTIQQNIKGMPKGITGFAVNIPEEYGDMTEEEYDEMMMERMELTQDEMSPEAYKELVDYVTQSSSYAEKVNTADVSVPVTHAAVGDENYVDAYTNAAQAGFEVHDGYIPGATLDNYSPQRESEGQPTGFAVNVQTQPSASKVTVGLDGTRTKVPSKANYSYTKNDVMDLVDTYADVFGIPRRVAHALVKQESGYQPHVASKAGAYGPCQLMPATAKNLGVDSKDPAQNVWGGMKYLSAQFQSFGNWGLALAAYNAGPGAVNKYKGIPPYPETQNYVRNILKMAGFSPSGVYPVDFTLSGGNIKFIDNNTGMLSAKSMNDFAYMLKNSPGYGDKIQVVYTDRPELTQNKPEYEAFAKYRQMKAMHNKPLFVYKPGVNGFSVMLKNNDIKPGFHSNATAAIADSVVTKQTPFLPENDRDKVEALIDTFSSRYKSPFESSKEFFTNQFGLANLTPQEYADYGVTADVVGNPELQARVLNLEFQRALDILGTDYKAIYAIAGGNVMDSKGNVKSWREVKQDKEAYMKQWYIKPSENAHERDIANAFVESYNKYYGRLRGEI